MIGLLGAVEKYILSRRLLRPGESVLVAVSGGVDSMVLWWVLRELAKTHRWRLAPAHFNHQLRGKESDKDELLVRETAKRWRCPCLTGSEDVRALAHARGISVEMAARQSRHEFLARSARQLGIRKIALGHHSNDQVEQFFLRLLRGAGPPGLGGLKPMGPSPADGRVQLVRPLLATAKSDLDAFAAAMEVPYREDASNRYSDFLRNRVRHELLPLLRERFQPGLDQVVLRAMTLLGDTADFVSSEAKQWLAGPGQPEFATLHPALQRSVLLAQLRRLDIEEDFRLVEDLRLNADKPVTVRPNQTVSRDLHGRLARQETGARRFSRRRLELDLARGTPRESFDGVDFSWRFVRGCALPSGQTGVEHFDAARVGTKIVLRHWQPGDRFHPIGLPRPVKLQDWFTNRKVPKAGRHKLVLAATPGGDVFWVEGQRISETHKVTAQTRRRLLWKWKRP